MPAYSPASVTSGSQPSPRRPVSASPRGRCAATHTSGGDVAVGPQPHGRAAQLEVLAVVVHRLVGREQQPQHLEALLEPAERLGVLHAEGGEVQHLARADAQDEAPLGEVVQREGGLGERGRVPAHHVGHADAEPHPLGDAGDRRDHRDRVAPDVRAALPGGLGHQLRIPDRVREPVQVVVGPPDGVEALLLAPGRAPPAPRRAGGAGRPSRTAADRAGGSPGRRLARAGGAPRRSCDATVSRGCEATDTTRTRADVPRKPHGGSRDGHASRPPARRDRSPSSPASRSCARWSSTGPVPVLTLWDGQVVEVA